MTGQTGCALDPVLSAVTKRWSASLLWLLCENGPTRSGVLMRSVEGASVKMLTERLRDLEGQGLVSRRQAGSAPSEVTYAVTARGLELRAMLSAMREVAERWSREDAIDTQGGAAAHARRRQIVSGGSGEPAADAARPTAG